MYIDVHVSLNKLDYFSSLYYIKVCSYVSLFCFRIFATFDFVLNLFKVSNKDTKISQTKYFCCWRNIARPVNFKKKVAIEGVFL